MQERDNEFDMIHNDTESGWNHLKNLIKSVTEQCASTSRPKKPWITDETWKRIEERKMAKIKKGDCHETNKRY
jgi:hypothetical protein